jgi:hypothetical protein
MKVEMTHREALFFIRNLFTVEQRELIATAIATAPVETTVECTHDQNANTVLVVAISPMIALANAIRN